MANKVPKPPIAPGQRAFNMAVQRHPATLYKQNYNLLPTTQTPKREHLFMPTPKGLPAVSKAPNPAKVAAHKVSVKLG